MLTAHPVPLWHAFSPQALVGNVTTLRANEHEQGVLRIAILGVVLTFVVLQRALGGASAAPGTLLVLIGGYLALSVICLLSVRANPAAQALRRPVMLCADVGIAAAAAGIGGEILAPFFALYIWIIAAYGIRYGRQYLHAATALGLTGFLVINVCSPFWIAHRPLAIPLGVTLLLLPLLGRAITGRCNRKRDRSAGAGHRTLARGVGSPLAERARLLVPPDTEPLRILVADDEPLNRLPVEVTLEDAGHCVVSVADGEAAAQALSAERFDIAILDWHMPGCTGLEVIGAHRARSGSGGLRFVVLSANAQIGAAEQAIAAGADRYLRKPVTPERLLETIRTLATDVRGEQGVMTSFENSPDCPVLDGPLLEEYAFDDEGLEFLEDINGRFLPRSDLLLARMDDALQSGDIPAFRDLAHQLRGAVSAAGALRLTAQAARIECIDDAALTAGAAALLSVLRVEQRRAGAALEAFVEACREQGT